MNSSPPSLHSYQWTISLCSLPSLWLFPSCLCALVAMSQLCKTKPISSTPKPMQPPLPERVTPILRSASPPKNKPKQSQSSNAIRNTQYAIRNTNPIKPNFKMGNINLSTATVKAYAKEQRTMNNERHSKQTQSNPIPPHIQRAWGGGGDEGEKNIFFPKIP